MTEPQPQDTKPRGPVVKAGPTGAVIVVRSWVCETHGKQVEQGQPCPDCHKHLLLD